MVLLRQVNSTISNNLAFLAQFHYPNHFSKLVLLLLQLLHAIWLNCYHSPCHHARYTYHSCWTSTTVKWKRILLSRGFCIWPTCIFRADSHVWLDERPWLYWSRSSPSTCNYHQHSSYGDPKQMAHVSPRFLLQLAIIFPLYLLQLSLSLNPLASASWPKVQNGG